MMPASMVVVNIDLNQKVNNVNHALKDIKSRIEMHTGDEDRASKWELTKSQIIMNLMQVKICKYKLPISSEQYEDDMRKVYEYIRSLDGLMKRKSNQYAVIEFDISSAGSLDFIYKLLQQCQ